MVQIKHKRGTGVETPSPRSFSGGTVILSRNWSFYLQNLSVYVQSWVYPQTEEIGLRIITTSIVVQRLETGLSIYKIYLQTVKVGCIHRQRKSDLESLRLSKFPTSFHRSPRTHQTRLLGTSRNFEQVFTCVNGVPFAQESCRENWQIWRSRYIECQNLVFLFQNLVILL